MFLDNERSTMSTAGHADRIVAGFRAKTGPIVGFRAAFAFLPPLEFLASSGVDYVYLDRQHGTITLEDVWTVTAAMSHHELAVLVRVSEQSHSEIGAVLDAGAHGVIVPDVVSAQEASQLLTAIRHPPRGTRSWGAYAYDSTGYAGPSARKEDPLFLPLVESGAGVDDVDAIAALPGVDAIYVGRFDLALSLGVPVSDVHPGGARHDVIERVRAVCDAAAIPMATTGVKSDLISQGFRMITLGSELDMLGAGLAAAQAA